MAKPGGTIGHGTGCTCGVPEEPEREPVLIEPGTGSGWIIVQRRWGRWQLFVSDYNGQVSLHLHDDAAKALRKALKHEED